MEKKNDMNLSRLAPENIAVTAINNCDLQCGTCEHRMEGNTNECKKYLRKPGYVLCGTRPCPAYEEEHQA